MGEWVNDILINILISVSLWGHINSWVHVKQVYFHFTDNTFHTPAQQVLPGQNPIQC